MFVGRRAESWHRSLGVTSNSEYTNLFPFFMKPTTRLLQHTARITLFTRKNCGLCDVAKSVLNNVAKTRSFEYDEIDVMAPGEREWRNAYEFDVPVVGNTTYLYRHSRAHTAVIVTCPAHIPHLC